MVSLASPAQELMAIQGFNPERFDMESRSYGFWNRIAGLAHKCHKRESLM
jgi:hypothetical protein